MIGFSCAPVQAGGAGACWKLVIWLPCQFVGEVAALLKRLEASGLVVCCGADLQRSGRVCWLDGVLLIGWLASWRAGVLDLYY